MRPPQIFLFLIALSALFASCQSPNQVLSKSDSRTKIMNNIASDREMSKEMMDAIMDGEHGKMLMHERTKTMMEDKNMMKKMMKDDPEMKKRMMSGMMDTVESDTSMMSQMSKSMMNNPKMKKRMMSTMMENAKTDTAAMVQMHTSMMNNPETKKRMMSKMMETVKADTSMMSQMCKSMMDNPQMMDMMKKMKEKDTSKLN